MSIVLLLKPKHSIGPETLKKKLSQLKLRKACSCLTEQAPQVMLMYLDLQSLFLKHLFLWNSLFQYNYLNCVACKSRSPPYPSLGVTEIKPPVACAELQCIVDHFTINNSDMRQSIFIGDVLIILTALGPHILHLTCAYFKRLFARCNKWSWHNDLKSVLCQQVYSTLSLWLPEKHKKYMPCSDEIFKEKAAVAGSVPGYFLWRTAQALSWTAVLRCKDHNWSKVF